MRKVLCPILFFLFIPLVFSFGEKNYTSEKVVFLPQDFFVGDSVEMRVVIKPAEGVRVSEPERFPDSYWIRIDKAEVMDLGGKYELRVFLRPYASGIRTLPPLQFGDVLLRDIRIRTSSVLDESSAGLSPPAGQMLLPGTRYYIALLVGLVFVLPVIVLVFWGRLRAAIAARIYDRLKRRPYRKFSRALDEIESGMGGMDGGAFYTALVDTMREYFTGRGSLDYIAATTREGCRGITRDFGSLDCSDDLAAVFLVADQVKFGDKEILEQEREAHIAVVRDAAVLIEKLFFGGENSDVDI